MRNQTDAKYLNGPIFSDFGPKSDFVGQKGPKMVLFCTQKSRFEQNGRRYYLKSIVLRALPMVLCSVLAGKWHMAVRNL